MAALPGPLTFCFSDEIGLYARVWRDKPRSPGRADI